MTRQKLISKLNAWGKDAKPFFFIFDFEEKHLEAFLLENVPDDIYFKIGNVEKNPKKQTFFPLNLSFELVPYSKFKNGFDVISNEIKKGNTYLTNLTYKHEIECNWDLSQIYLFSDAVAKLLYKNKFVVFSPEKFIEISENNIYTYPMKGTINADMPLAAQTLLKDLKERAEHATVVDLLRNDLGIISDQVEVERYRYIDHLNTNHFNLLQTSSIIKGKLESSWQNRIGNLLMHLLPAGSISGAPKKKTVEIIKNAEDGNRGHYTGVFGYFDGDHVYSNVMIRYIENNNGQYFFRSGGGITSFSEPLKEYEELKQKIYVPIHRKYLH